MNGRRSILRVSAVVLSAVLLTACTGGETEQETSPRPAPSVAWSTAAPAEVVDGGTLTVGLLGLPENFNPEHSSNSDIDLSLLLSPTTGSAVRITEDGDWEVDPSYARAVEVVSQSPLRVRVELNREAVWQGGTPITADDMIAYVKAHDGSDDDYDVFSTRGWDTISSVEQGRDEYEYTVTFDEPIADWPRFVYPALPAAVSSSPGKFNERYVDRFLPSNGPFIVQEVDRDRGRIVMEPNRRWWGAAPKLDRIVWQTIDPAQQVAAVAGGELDVATVQAEGFAALDGQQVDGAAIQVAAGTDWTQLTMNGARGPLKQTQVRRAVAAALDREALAALSSAPVGAVASVPGSFVLVPGQHGYVDQSDRIVHDVAVARDLLDDAGWTVPADGMVREREGEPLRLVMPVPTNTPTIAARARLIAEQLAVVGIGVDLQSVPAEEYYSTRIIPLDFDLATFTHAGSAFPVVDAEALFHPLDSGRNFTGLDDERLAALWDAASTALSDEDRSASVQKVDQRLFRDVPIVPLGMVPRVVIVRDGVVNIGASQFLRPDWTRVGQRAEDS